VCTDKMIQLFVAGNHDILSRLETS
jgi:hypothetical protein